MNIRLPKKEKLNKKMIIIYLTAAIICILAIVVIMGVQVLGDEVINNLFGIDKIVTKTEEEEARLKANFETLFNNQLENKDNNRITKVDNEKEIVYTNYENTSKSSSDYELDVNIPYINIKNRTVETFNEEIKNTFQAKAEEILQTTGKNTIYTVKYTSYLKNNILSLVIYSDLKQDKSAQRIILQTFNFNLENNKELSFEDILNIYNLDKKDVQDKINKDIKQEQNKAEELKDLGYNVFSRDLNSDIYKVENITEFFIHEGNIYIIFAYGNDKITSERDIVII